MQEAADYYQALNEDFVIQNKPRRQQKPSS
jgi:hypothetical protein